MLTHNSRIETNSRGWRDGSVTKSTCCFCRELGFSSQHPNGSSQSSGTPFPGNLMFSLASVAITEKYTKNKIILKPITVKKNHEQHTDTYCNISQP